MVTVRTPVCEFVVVETNESESGCWRKVLRPANSVTAVTWLFDEVQPGMPKVRVMVLLAVLWKM